MERETSVSPLEQAGPLNLLLHEIMNFASLQMVRVGFHYQQLRIVRLVHTPTASPCSHMGLHQQSGSPQLLTCLQLAPAPAAGPVPHHCMRVCGRPRPHTGTCSWSLQPSTNTLPDLATTATSTGSSWTWRLH